MALKITGPDFDRLRQAVQAEPVQIYARAKAKEYLDLHNSPGNPLYQRPYARRWRWDVFHRACQFDAGLLKHLYAYLTDDNSDAALRRIVG